MSNNTNKEDDKTPKTSPSPDTFSNGNLYTSYSLTNKTGNSLREEWLTQLFETITNCSAGELHELDKNADKLGAHPLHDADYDWDNDPLHVQENMIPLYEGCLMPTEERLPGYTGRDLHPIAYSIQGPYAHAQSVSPENISSDVQHFFGNFFQGWPEKKAVPNGTYETLANVLDTEPWYDLPNSRPWSNNTNKASKDSLGGVMWRYMRKNVDNDELSFSKFAEGKDKDFLDAYTPILIEAMKQKGPRNLFKRNLITQDMSEQEHIQHVQIQMRQAANLYQIRQSLEENNSFGKRLKKLGENYDMEPRQVARNTVPSPSLIDQLQQGIDAYHAETINPEYRLNLSTQ